MSSVSGRWFPSSSRSFANSGKCPRKKLQWYRTNWLHLSSLSFSFLACLLSFSITVSFIHSSSLLLSLSPQADTDVSIQVKVQSKHYLRCSYTWVLVEWVGENTFFSPTWHKQLQQGAVEWQWWSLLPWSWAAPSLRLKDKNQTCYPSLLRETVLLSLYDLISMNANKFSNSTMLWWWLATLLYTFGCSLSPGEVTSLPKTAKNSFLHNFLYQGSCFEVAYARSLSYYYNC